MNPGEPSLSFYFYTALLLAIGFVLSIPLKKKGFPVSIAYLLSGIMVSAFIEIPGNALIFLKGIEELAIVLLFFDIGYELDLENIHELVGFPLLLTLMEVSIALLMSLGLGLLLGLDVYSAMIIGLASSFSSTVFTYKLMDETRVSRDSVRDLIYRVVIVEDVFLIVSLGLIESAGTHGVFPYSILIPLTFPLILFTLSYWFTHRVLKKYLTNDENGVVLLISYGLMLAYVSVLVGSSPAIGAFVAGLSLSGVHGELIETIRKINGFALLLFFISLGIGVSSYHVEAGQLVLALLLSIAMVFIHTIATMTSSMLMSGHSILYGLETGIYLSTLSELGLLVSYRALQNGLAPGYIVLAVPLGVVLASVTSALMVSRRMEIVVGLYRRIPRGLRDAVDALTISIRGGIFSKRYGLLVKLLHSLTHLLGELVLLSFTMAVVADYVYGLTMNTLIEVFTIVLSYILIVYWAVRRSIRISDRIIGCMVSKPSKSLVSETHRFVGVLAASLSLLTSLLTIIVLNYESLSRYLGGALLVLVGLVLFAVPSFVIIILYLVEK